MQKEIANIAAVTKNGQKQIVFEMKANKGILLEVLAYAMKTRPNSLGCVFCLNEAKMTSFRTFTTNYMFKIFNLSSFLENSLLLFSLFPMV